MPAVTRLADICTGHSSHPSRPCITASDNVFTNSRGTHRRGDRWSPHNHSGILMAGSNSVFVNGRAISRKADPIDCGSLVLTGSPNVFAGG